MDWKSIGVIVTIIIAVAGTGHSLRERMEDKIEARMDRISEHMVAMSETLAGQTERLRILEEIYRQGRHDR